MALPVRLMPSRVRPWNPWSKAIDAAAARGVAGHLHGVLDGLGSRVHEEGALLVVARRELVEALAHLDVAEVRRDLEARVGEALDLFGTAATTRGALLPTLVTEIPEARSISRLPSTSSTIPPPARATNTPSVVPTPAGIAAARRSMSARDRGPGISVCTSRLWGTWSVVVSMQAPRARSSCPAYGRARRTGASGGVDLVGADVGTVHEVGDPLDAAPRAGRRG